MKKPKITCPDCSKCPKELNCDEFQNAHTVPNTSPDYVGSLKRRASRL